MLASSVRRYLIWVSYDGSRFPEMAKGGTGYGITDFIAAVVRSSFPLIGDQLKISPSSRTDAGVHALRNAMITQIPTQYGVLDDKRESYLSEWNTVAEKCVPGGVRFLDAHSVSPGFCARRNVGYRRYKYRICVAKNEDIWARSMEQRSLMQFAEREYVWMLPPGFHPYRAHKACSLFQGTQNMASFMKHPERDRRRQKEYPSTIKHLMHIGVSPGSPKFPDDNCFAFYDFSIISRSFLREQIRRMMAVIVGHAYGNVTEELIVWLLKNPRPSNFSDRRIKVAPSHGLYLEEVVYDKRMFANPIPYNFHNWDLIDCDSNSDS